MRRNMPKRFAFYLFAILTAPAVCTATIMSSDWKISGDEKLTLDSDTGLEWLDINETVNRSFSDVSNQFGVGGDFEGFRYASVAEFETLLTNAGILSYSFGSTYYSEIALLQNFLSTTFNSSTQANSFGIFADSSISNFDRRGADLYTVSSTSGGVFFGDQTNAASSTKGSWLVRSAAVPEPGILALMGLGLAAIGYRRHSSKKAS